MHKHSKLDEVYPVSDEEAEEEKAPVYKRCNYRKSWRDHVLPFLFAMFTYTVSGRSRLVRTSIHDVLRHPGIGQYFIQLIEGC